SLAQTYRRARRHHSISRALRRRGVPAYHGFVRQGGAAGAMSNLSEASRRSERYLPADGRALALLDELATRLLRDEGREIGQLERALHALLVLSVRLTRAGATAGLLDGLSGLLDGRRVLALRADACSGGWGDGEDGQEGGGGADATISDSHEELLRARVVLTRAGGWQAGGLGVSDPVNLHSAPPDLSRRSVSAGGQAVSEM